MKNNSKSTSANKNAPQTPISPLNAAPAQPNEKINRRFRVQANLCIAAAAEVVIEASDPAEADKLVESLLRERPLVVQLNKILELHTLSVAIQPDRQVAVRLESVQPDWPPEVMVWKMTELGPNAAVFESEWEQCQ